MKKKKPYTIDREFRKMMKEHDKELEEARKSQINSIITIHINPDDTPNDKIPNWLTPEWKPTA